MIILDRQPVSEVRSCNACTKPLAERIARTMHWRDADRMWRCEVCIPFRVEAIDATDHASAPPALVVEPPSSAEQSASPRARAGDGGALPPIAVRAVRTFGTLLQTAQAIEECAELIVALRHFARGKASADDVAGEIADVDIMLDQLTHIVGGDRVAAAKARKLLALEKLIEAAR